MADATPATPAVAPKATSHAKEDAERKLTDSPQWSENENGDVVFHGEFPDQERIDRDRKIISDELKNSDRYESDGLADNVSGDASEKASDPFLSPDPAKRPFPPGPDDPSKLA